MQDALTFSAEKDVKKFHVKPREASLRDGVATAALAIKGRLTFPTDGVVRFEPGAFTHCPLITHVDLPDTVLGAPLNTVFDSHVTVSNDGVKTNTPTTLRPTTDKAIPLPLYVPPPQVRTGELSGGILGIGVANGNNQVALLSALDFPHTATFMPKKESGGAREIGDVTDWFRRLCKSVTPVALGGTYWVTERTIVLAMVRDGMVYDRFPIPTTVTMTSHLLNHIDAADCMVTREGKYSNPTDTIELGAYYAVF